MTKQSEVFESTWSDDVANDPKHRPQQFNRPATTVRKEWCRRPQEAHIAEGEKYRRLSVDEIAVIQGFEPGWVDLPDLKENDRIALLGNAVPPPLAKAVGAALKKSISTLTSVEICAGIGGLSTGFSYLNPLTKIEMWDLACKVLRHHFPPEVVVEGPVQDFDFSSLKGKVGLLFGGPPCQPWSQAGNRLGAQDPRDVMGITPDIIAACEPDVFLFENVPGLITSKEHEEYRANLFSRLEQPKSGLKYGVDFKILNAADYGVPQLRRRVFIVGIRNKSNVAARKLLADVMASTTHHDPDKPAYKKAPWVTLREALADVPQAEAWRKWNKIASQYEEDIVEANDKPSSATPSNPNIDQTPAQTRIGFWWPKREYNLIFKDEKWTFVPRERKRDVRALTFFDKIPSTETGPTHYAIVGDYAPTIEALAPISKGTIKFSYWDMPRIDKGGDFATETEPGYVRSAWMSLLRDVSSSIHRCLQPEAYFAVQTDEESAHYARIVLDETFGPENHITTFAWEKKYSPQNDRNTPTDSFDYIIVYSNTHRDNISERIGLVVSAKNVLDDGDPRGCYTAGHKGARSGNERSKFKVNMPPYRWELQNSKLPQCQFHWFDPITGVLYIKGVQQHGQFDIDVICKDSAGASTTAKISFEIQAKTKRTDVWTPPESIWWLDAENSQITPVGKLTIDTTKPPAGFVGSDFSIVLKAKGGRAFVGKSSAPGSGRFWEFSLGTLTQHILQAAASFGKNGMSLPSEKKFMPRTETTKRISVRNWLPWYIGGKSEDAARHLKQLSEIGYGAAIEKSTAKPEPLCHYLVQLFAPNQGDTVISLGDGYATMASATIKSGRQAIHLVGPSPKQQALWNETANPRLRAVYEKKDVWGISGELSDDEEDAFTQAESGPLLIAKLSKSSIVRRGLNNTSLEMSEEEDYATFVAALRGCLPKQGSPTGFEDRDGNRCVVVPPDEDLDGIRLAELTRNIPQDRVLFVMYERSSLPEGTNVHQQVRLVRVPFEVA